MRHRKDVVKLGRTPSHRKALFRNLATSLIEFERIETTLAKAKALRRIGEKVITLAKKNTLHTRRQALKVINKKEVVKKLFDIIGPRYENRNGGYTRILKLGLRHGDCASMAIIELVGNEKAVKAEKEKGKKGGAKKAVEVKGKPGKEKEKKSKKVEKKADGKKVEKNEKKVKKSVSKEKVKKTKTVDKEKPKSAKKAKENKKKS